MDRLTENVLGNIQLKDCGNDFCKETCAEHDEEKSCDNCPIQKAFERLSEYEGLEEQGRLLKLPCAVGDTVYRINKGAKQPIIPLQVLNFKIFNNNLVESFKMECADEWDGGYSYRKTDIGRDVFLTRPEAERALAEMEGKK